MKLIAALALLTLAGCSTGNVPAPAPPPPVQYPSAPHWLMRPKSWAEYQEFSGKGFYDPAAKTLHGSTDAVVQTFRITNLATFHNGKPAIARVYGAAGVQVDTVPPDSFSALIQQAYGPWIGEAANYGCSDIFAPEPVATITPILGQTFNPLSTVKQPNGPDFPFQTWYRTDSVGAEVKTTLIEQPDLPGMCVYHYTFDGELKRLVFGHVEADNTVPKLTIYTRTAVGDNA